MTALLLAASKRAWEAVDCLLAKGADPLQKDAKNRNLLHLVIMNNGKPTDFTICFQNSVSLSCKPVSFSYLSWTHRPRAVCSMIAMTTGARLCTTRPRKGRRRPLKLYSFLEHLQMLKVTTWNHRFILLLGRFICSCT